MSFASTYYVTTDHLGSGDLVMDSAATVLARESFTPFGARRGSNWQGSPTAADYSAFSSTTRRGFTGHEMLDYVNLVHMNGRVYDPYLGRFLSTDPIVQTLNFGQAINPYSYVMNDPLSLIDPSGYSWLSSLFHSIGHFFSTFWRPILAIVVGAITYGLVYAAYMAPYAGMCVASSVSIAGGALAGSAAGLVSGAIMGGVKGAITGAISGALFGGIQGAFQGSWNLERATLDGVAGGVSAEMNGGNFGKGFATGFGLSVLQWGASKMREEMLAQSRANSANDSGPSAGWRGDGSKLAGARFEEATPSNSVSAFLRRIADKLWPFKHPILGGDQGGQGYLLDRAYGRGSWEDNLLEAYAGPHDWLSSNFYYQNTGNIVRMGALGHLVFSVQSAAALVPATAFVGADVVPGIAFQPDDDN